MGWLAGSEPIDGSAEQPANASRKTDAGSVDGMPAARERTAATRNHGRLESTLQSSPGSCHSALCLRLTERINLGIRRFRPCCETRTSRVLRGSRLAAMPMRLVLSEIGRLLKKAPWAGLWPRLVLAFPGDQMIEIQHLSKHFGSFRAVDDVSLTVAPGEVLGFLGPNGAGKSTTMKMVTGFLSPSKGTAKVCDHDVKRDPMSVKRAVGYLPEGAPLYPDMTPLGLLRFAAAARDIENADQRIAQVIERVELGSVRNKRIETLSKGFKRRVGLALAIVHDPAVLILDEPTDGLDPTQKHQVRTLIKEMAQGKVIVLSTHILEEVEAVCSRAVIIAKGQLKFDGTPTELRLRSRHAGAVEVHINGSPGGVKESLSALSGVSAVETINNPDGTDAWLVFPGDGQVVLPKILTEAQSRSWDITHLHVEPGRLDDVFRTITQGEVA